MLFLLYRVLKLVYVVLCEEGCCGYSVIHAYIPTTTQIKHKIIQQHILLDSFSNFFIRVKYIIHK